MIEILIGGQRVYAGDNIGMNVSKSIFDLLEPDKRKSDFTKTVEIQGTKEADQVFKALYNVNFNISGAAFDPNKRKEAIIYIDTLPVLIGYCQLTDITILNENSHFYSVVFYGTNADIFKSLQDNKLSDIDWSDLNHTWNRANIEASWTTPIGENYVYPFVNYGYQDVGGFTLQVEDMRPWLYMKEIWDRIFSEAGITYTSDFINSDKFKRLIYSCDEPIKRPLSEIADSEVEVDMVTAQDITTNGAVVAFNGTAIGGGVLDWGGAPSYTYTTASKGVYNIGGLLRIRLKFTGTFNSQRIVSRFVIQHRRGVTVINNQHINTTHQGTFTTTSNTIEQPFNAEYVCEAGDEIRIILEECLVDNVGGGIQSFLGIATTAIEVRPSGVTSNKPFLVVRLSEKVVESNTMNVGLFAAGKLSQRDFVLGVLKMFNMRFDPQPDGSILVEPRDDYYTSDVIDLTKKLDTSREFVIKPLDQSKYRKYVFKYKNSKDFFNTNHLNAFNQTWGHSEVTIDNDFANGDKVTELPWSLPVVANSVVSSYANTFKPAAILYNENNQGIYAGNEIPKVLVYGGLTSSFSLFRVQGGTPSASFPYAGIQDSLTAPTFDITFDEQPTYYWQNITNGQVVLSGNGGLYPQFHEREILELTNKNSKIVECFVKLTPYDYYTLSFRKLYFIRDAYYRIYEVQDYNPLSYDPTKLILLKIEEVPKRVVSAIDVVADQIWDNIKDGANDPILVSRSSKFGQFDGVVGIGDGNFVSGNNILVSGDNNDVQGDNIVVLNLNGQVPSSGTINIGFNLVTIDDDYTLIGQEGSPIYIHSTGLGAVTIELIIAGNAGKVAYVSADNPCTVISDATLNDTGVTYGHYYNNGTDWIKFG
jgi:hypothetical protein